MNELDSETEFVIKKKDLDEWIKKLDGTYGKRDAEYVIEQIKIRYDMKKNLKVSRGQR